MARKSIRRVITSRSCDCESDLARSRSHVLRSLARLPTYTPASFVGRTIAGMCVIDRRRFHSALPRQRLRFAIDVLSRRVRPAIGVRFASKDVWRVQMENFSSIPVCSRDGIFFLFFFCRNSNGFINGVKCREGIERLKAACAKHSERAVLCAARLIYIINAMIKRCAIENIDCKIIACNICIVITPLWWGARLLSFSSGENVSL